MISSASPKTVLESPEMFRLLVEQVMDYAIFMLDPEGYILSWNEGARRIKGYKDNEIIGKHFSTFYLQADLESQKPARELEIAKKTGRYEEEGWRLRKDGTRFWANVVITALKNDKGELTGFAKVTRDLTKRNQEEIILRQKNQALEAFAHTISHDLRAPIRSMRTFSEILLEEASGSLNEQAQDYLRRISQSARRMDRLVNDLLQYSQISMGEVKPQPVALQHAASEAIHLLEQEIQRTGAEVSIHLPPAEILATPTFLSQVFLNLISNGIKFVPDTRKPKIKISAELQGQTIRISVSDNGIGIEERFYEKIFKVFERVHTEKNISGTGIGLAIVKQAIERMGGRISVHSVLDEGSTFVITLPIFTGNFQSSQPPETSLHRENQKHAA